MSRADFHQKTQFLPIEIQDFPRLVHTRVSPKKKNPVLLPTPTFSLMVLCMVSAQSTSSALRDLKFDPKETYSIEDAPLMKSLAFSFPVILQSSGTHVISMGPRVDKSLRSSLHLSIDPKEFVNRRLATVKRSISPIKPMILICLMYTVISVTSGGVDDRSNYLRTLKSVSQKPIFDIFV